MTPAESASPPRFTYVAALLVGAVAFGFRFLILRSLPNDHYLYLAWAQQMLLGEIPGRDFVEPGMPLQILLSAAGQAMASGPATEGILAIGMLAVAAAATCIAVAWLTRSVAAGALAAAFQILIQPRLYSYPKILVPAVLVVLALWYARRPATASLFVLAAWIAAAFLFRHDLGVYAAVGGVLIVTLSHQTLAQRARDCARLAMAVLVILLPYFAFLEWRGGLVEHVRGALEYAKSETHHFEFEWPVLAFGASQPDSALPWNQDDAAAFLFYCAYTLPVVSLLLLLRPENRRDVVVRAGVAAAIGVAVLYTAVILRYPLTARVQDLAAVFAILGAWCASALLRLSRRPRAPALLSWQTAVRVSVAAVFGIAALSVEVLGHVREEFRETRFLEGPSEMKEQAASVLEAGATWPWEQFWPAGPLPPAVEYLDTCTAAEDRILVTWSAPEYYFFARRGFAAGHAVFLAPRAYTSDRDQALMVSRLAGNRLPLVLINESTRAEFAEAYPRVDEYLRRHYTSAGQFTIRDGSSISIAIRHGLRPTGVYGDNGWPCLVSDPAGTTASPARNC